MSLNRTALLTFIICHLVMSGWTTNAQTHSENEQLAQLTLDELFEPLIENSDPSAEAEQQFRENLRSALYEIPFHKFLLERHSRDVPTDTAETADHAFNTFILDEVHSALLQHRINRPRIVEFQSGQNGGVALISLFEDGSIGNVRMMFRTTEEYGLQVEEVTLPIAWGETCEQPFFSRNETAVRKSAVLVKSAARRGNLDPSEWLGEAVEVLRRMADMTGRYRDGRC